MMQGRTFNDAGPYVFFFLFFLQGKVSQCESNQASLNRSTKSGTKPSVLLQASTLETQQVANARAHEIDNMRIHLRLQDNWTDHCSTCGASRALAHHVHESLPPRCSIGHQSQCQQQPVGSDLPPTVLSTSRFSPFLHGGALPVGVRCVGARETCSSGRTTQCDVDGKLCSMMEKQTRGHDLNRSLQRTAAPASRRTLASVLSVGSGGRSDPQKT